MDSTKEFAKALYNRRKQLGLTQDEVAEKVGTSKQMVSMYELGKRSPKILMANRFAEALGTTLDKLMSESETFSTNELMLAEKIHTEKTDEGRIAAALIDRLPKSQRKQIISVIYAMYPQLKEGGSK